MPQVLVIGGTHSGVGKTSFTLGLVGALRRRGLVVQCFKVGPDFADPVLHAAASSRPCINLDGWVLSQEAVAETFWSTAADCDVAIVEGVMGLFDGADDCSEAGSTAQIAKWLGAPVLLVIDASTIARSIAAVIKGCQSFDTSLFIPAVVLNKATSAAHVQSLSDAIRAANLGVTVLGGLLKEERFDLVNGSDRSSLSGAHMELPPGHIGMLADAVESGVQLDHLLALAATRHPPVDAPWHSATPQLPRVKLGLAWDAAFSFYHHQNLALLEAAGVELVRFSPMADPRLPPGIAGLYLGGGHPEHHCAALGSNAPMLAAVRALCEAGGVVYAEAGGLMYLSQSIQLPSRVTTAMAGVFPFRTRITTDEPQSGYVTVTPLPACPVLPPGTPLRGHYHHRSEIVEETLVAGLAAARAHARRHHCTYTAALAGPTAPAPEVPEGYTLRNTLASYVHLHFASAPAAAPHLAARLAAVDADALTAEAAAAAAGAAAAAAAQRPHPAALLLQAAQGGGVGGGGAVAAHMLADSSSMGDLRSGAPTPMSHSPTASEDNLQRLLGHHGGHAASCGDLSAMGLHHPAAAPNGSHPHPHHLAPHPLHPASLPPRGRSAEALYPPPHHPMLSSASHPHPHHDSPLPHNPPHPHPHPPLSLTPEKQPPRLPALKIHAAAPPADATSETSSTKLSDGSSTRSPDSSTTTLQLTPSKLQPQTHTKLIGISVPLTRPAKPTLAPPPLPTPAQDIADRISRSHSATSSTSASNPFSWHPHPTPHPPSLPSSARPSLEGALHLTLHHAASASAPSLHHHPALHPRTTRYPAATPNDLICSFSPASTEALLAMGLGPRLVGITDCCEAPPDPRTPRTVIAAMTRGPVRGWWAAHSLAPPATSVDPSAPLAAAGAAGAAGGGGGGAEVGAAGGFTVDEDFLREEQPSLVVMQEPGGCYCPDKETVQRGLQRAGLLRPESATCLQQLRCHTLSDVLESLLALGRAAAATEPAQQLVDRLRSRLRRAAGIAAQHPTRLRVLCLVSLEPLVPGTAWISEMLSLAGAADLHLDMLAPTARPDELTWEDVVALAPDVLLICHPYQRTDQTLQQVASLAGQPGWWSLPAVRGGQVYVLHPSLAARPGPRLVDGVEVLTRILHPGQVTKRAAAGMVLRLSLQGGQRCRQKLLPNYFMPFV